MNAIPKRFVRLYMVDGQFPNSSPEAPRPDPTKLSLTFIDRFPSHSKAAQFLHSKECLQQYLRDQGKTEADFLIIGENNHFRVAPVTVILPRPLSTPITDQLTGRLT